MNADTGLEQRLNFIGINAHSQARLRELKPLLEKVMGPALDVFYERVQSTPQTRVFFPTPAIIAHAKEKQSAHWRVITDAQYGADYATNVRAIGQAHARFGLEPRWYIGGYAIVIEQLIQAIVNTRWPRLLSGGQKAATEVAESLSALVKASLLDMDLAISIYLESLEARRQEEEVKRLKAQQEQTAALTALAVALDRLAKGDLTVKFDAAVAPDFDKLKDDVNNTVARLAKAMLSVAQAADAINNGAAEITVAADEMASRGERQAASLEQSTAAINLLSASVGEAAKAARQVAETASTTRKNVEHSSSVVDETVAAMAAIEASSRQIAQTVGIIDEIAFQTNLLALNAGVEAARAGEAG
ncbi:MAG: protoglobin domain-containing protein, partial [Methylovirgula sp.]